jgi:hypothetical protein
MNPTTYKPKNDTDEQNPDFMFSMTPTDLLVAIATGKIDPRQLALIQLRGRGQDPTDGEWVGFEGHGRLENLMKKHNFKLRPVGLIEADRSDDRTGWTNKEGRTITRIISLLKEKKELLALELALISGQTVQYYTLQELKK